MEHDITLELLQGDIARQTDLDAVVNAANAELMLGGGVAGALHRAAGPGLAEECRALAPIKPGQAVVTSGHQLPNGHVVHALGPVYGKDEPADGLLADAYRNALLQADAAGIESVGFPALSTGAFGYPVEDAARIALDTCLNTFPDLESIRLVRFVLFSERDLGVHQDALAAVQNRMEMGGQRA